MARAGLLDHRKFKRMTHMLQEPVPHCVGYLECLWNVAYQHRSDFIGDVLDVALAAQFPGEPAKIVSALYQEGGGFIEEKDGLYYVHDLYDHAPDYVRKRLVRRTADNGGQTADNGMQGKEKDKRREEKNKTPLPPKGGSRRSGSPEVDPLSLPLPPILDTPDFRRSWAEWIAYRRDRRLSMRPQTLGKQLKFLATFGDKAPERIDESIRNGWQGVFAPKFGGKGQPLGDKPPVGRPLSSDEMNDPNLVYNPVSGRLDRKGD